ncbi:MAG: glycosyltransferase family 9 protein [Ignavibacteriales bacterium]|nr:glycosyltransferase family 9 protein [Ignavibacteriales bacterium]
MKVLKTAERFGKKFLTSLIKLFIKQDNYSTSEIDPTEVTRIIIVHLDRKIGNLILSTPLFEATNKVFVNATIDIVIASPVKVLIDSNPFIQNIYEFNHTGFIRNPFKLFSLLSAVRKNNYQVAIESSNPSGTSFLNGFVTYLTKAKYRIGFSGGGGELFTNIHIIPDKNDHYFVSKQKLVTPFTSIDSQIKPKIFTNKNEVELTKQEVLTRYNLNVNQKIIGLWIGARDRKKWDIENFYAIYNNLKTDFKYFPILLFGIEEKSLFKTIDKNNYNSILFNDLNKLKNFISCCEVFISGDTGPLHYAYALDVITIGIFLQDNYSTYGYSSEGKNFIVKPGKTEDMIDEVIRICKTFEMISEQ